MKFLPEILTPDGLRQSSAELARRALNQTLRLAVTGLSGSGKTVFITSLIHQILRLTHTEELPFLEASERIAGSRIVRHPNPELPDFPYEEHLKNLSRNPPRWPLGTDGISQIRLAIRFRPKSRLRTRISELKTVYIDVIDYPGEWLLDLALLEMDFEQWCRQAWEQCEEEPRKSLSQNWRRFILDISPLETINDNTTEKVALLYSNFLHRSKAAGMSHLQPGRFTMPGELKGSPLLAFCPVPPQAGNSAVEALRKTMALRYETYKREVVSAFYEKHFSRFDRQIVLVDLLKALNAGYTQFRDMQDALNSILKSFRYGKSSFVTKPFNTRIDKLLFAATKADNVPADQHVNLNALLKSMISASENDARFDGVTTDTLTTSAIKSAHMVRREHRGRQLNCVRGIPQGRKEEEDVYPGDVPSKVPKPRDWDQGRFDFPDFLPPLLHNPKGQGIPNIRLDKALAFLIGDRLS